MIAEELLTSLRARALKLATAESCTGGMVAAAITDISGSSDVFDRGFVTYSNAAKTEMLGVPKELIAAVGAVSEDVAGAMARGALLHSHADVAVAVTGIAGPGGGTADKPVGLVHFAVATRGGVLQHLRQEYGTRGRAAIRAAACDQALRLVLLSLNSND